MCTEQEQFDRDFNDWLAKMEENIKRIEESEILTAEDYGIVINVR